MDVSAHSIKPPKQSGLLLFVFLLSLASIAFEIALTRIFSITQWNHLAFMVISIALLGFAAGGTLLWVLESRNTAWYRHTNIDDMFPQIALLFALSIVLALLWLARIPLDYFRLPLEPIQSAFLLVAFLLLALPFFCAGLIIALGYIIVPHKSGLVYFATMSGSAVGAVLPFFLLPLFGETGLVLVLACLPLGPLFIKKPAVPRNATLSCKSSKRGSGVLKAIGLGTLVLGAGLFLMDRTAVRLTPSPYKALSQHLMLPQTQVSSTFHSLRGRYDVLNSPYIRFAPGLSLTFNHILPSQTAFFKDLDNQMTLYSGSPTQLASFTRYMLPYCGYHLVPDPENVLLILYNGGTSLPAALATGAQRVTVIARDPLAARLVEAHYDRPVISQNPRVYLTRTHAHYDIIHLENWGTSLPGTSALTYENTLTVDAFELYLAHLNPNGVLLLTRKLLLPPSDSIRLWATAFTALKRSGVARPERHIAVLRSWDTYLIMVCAQPLSLTTSIEQIANQLNFDVVYLPGDPSQPPNSYNVFKAPFHHVALKNLAKAYRAGTAPTFFHDYLLDVAPQSDERPFPGRFLKWTKIRQYYQAMGSRLYTLLLSGEVVVGVVLIEATLVSIVILLVPLFFLRRTRRGLPLSGLLYFMTVGFGFMLVELYLINAFTLFFDETVVSFTIVLTGVLISSSIGGFVSQRLDRYRLYFYVAVLVGLLAGLGLAQDTWSAFYLGLPDGIRHLLALAFLFPIGFLLGLPFPLGMRLLVPEAVQRAHAWAVNGCASVITSVVATQMAISLGLPSLILGAVACYAIAMLCLGFIK